LPSNLQELVSFRLNFSLEGSPRARRSFGVTVPAIRIHKANQQPIHDRGAYVLYWMIASRRLRYNFALDRALEHCRSLHKPLLVFEPLRVGYQWANDRIHRFVLDGMADNARVCASRGIQYESYVEPLPGSGKGLLAALAENACVVVTDEFPCFFLPKMVASAAKQVPVLLEQVDSNGLLPLRATDHAAQRAFDFRRILQKELPKYLEHFPHSDPLSKSNLLHVPSLSRESLAKWPPSSEAFLAADHAAIAHLPIDHSVKPTQTRGGYQAARAQMRIFFEKKFRLYAEHRNQPEMDVTSGLSPYLHFGHISVHEIFSELAHRETWKPQKLSLRPNGSRDDWWNMSPAAESFLDELVTWREVGYNFAFHRQDYDQYDSLPDWAQKTLQEHAKDKRESSYTLRKFENAETHDSLWNAAQTQLVREGTIHNYLRMLWGKKILEWSRTPQDAAKIMIHLNNKYGLDGRDPNSYSGIFWVLGRYDRPWGPQRPIFGTVRYMSSENTARKVSVKNYIHRYTVQTAQQPGGKVLVAADRSSSSDS
jgi:deoxyribodipyrimidine photo-lyase